MPRITRDMPMAMPIGMAVTHARTKAESTLKEKASNL